MDQIAHSLYQVLVMVLNNSIMVTYTIMFYHYQSVKHLTYHDLNMRLESTASEFRLVLHNLTYSLLLTTPRVTVLLTMSSSEVALVLHEFKFRNLPSIFSSHAHSFDLEFFDSNEPRYLFLTFPYSLHLFIHCS